MELPQQQTSGQRHPSIHARLTVHPHPAPEKVSGGMRRRHPGQQEPPGDLIPDDRQKDHQQTGQLNPLVRRRLPAPRAHRTLWKYPQPAMLAIHGNLAFSPDGDTAPAAKSLLHGKCRAYWSDVQAPPNERPLPQSRAPMHSRIPARSANLPNKKRGQGDPHHLTAFAGLFASAAIRICASL